MQLTDRLHFVLVCSIDKILGVIHLCFKVERMSSTTTPSTTINYTTPFDLSTDEQMLLWNISAGISTFCTLLVLYFSSSVTSFIRKKTSKKSLQWAPTSPNQFNKRVAVALPNTTNSSPFFRKAATHKSRADRELVRYKKVLHYILFVIMFLALLRALEEAALLYFGNTSDLLCDIFSKLSTVLTAVVIYGCHCFLWVRQRVISSNPILKGTQPPFVHHVSNVTFVFMALALLGSIAILVFWTNYHAIGGICQADIASQHFSVAIPFGISSGLTAVIQLLLSFLFVYPSIYYKQKLKSRKEKEKAKIYKRPRNRNANKSQSAFSKKLETLNQTVKRSLVCSTITITTDCLGPAAVIFFPSNITCAVIAVSYHVNVVLNIVCLFFTYNKWKKLFVPWLPKKK